MSTRITRRTTLALGAAALVTPAISQPRFPDRPVRLICPWPAGGSTDGQMRAFADAAAKHLGQPVVELLRDTPHIAGNPWVIPGTLPGKRLSDLQPFWQRVRARAGVKDVRIHDLRHSAASMAAANGASLSQIGAMLGHKSAQATYMYQHLVDDDVRNVATGVAASIEAAIAAPAKVKRLRRRR